MIKQIFIYLTLVLFTTCVAAEDFIMKCGDNTYKYIKDPTGDQVFVKHPWSNNEYVEFCTKEIIADDIISIEGWVRIIKDKKATCILKKLSFRDNSEMTNNISIIDFMNLTRHHEFYHTKTGSKKNVNDYVCKKRKK
jgi:hypothetical protein